jgi:mandelate racemase
MLQPFGAREKKEQVHMDISARLTTRAIRARGLNVMLDRPIQTASGVMNTMPLVLVDLSTQEGITGHSYVRCYTPGALQPLVQLIANLENCSDARLLHQLRSNSSSSATFVSWVHRA